MIKSMQADKSVWEHVFAKNIEFYLTVKQRMDYRHAKLVQ
jgi:hypothetical protein